MIKRSGFRVDVAWQTMQHVIHADGIKSMSGVPDCLHDVRPDSFRMITSDPRRRSPQAVIVHVEQCNSR